MFPLPPREAVFIAELYRYFPDAREVTGAEVRVSTGPVETSAVPGTDSAPVTSQASLFVHAPRRAA